MPKAMFSPMFAPPIRTCLPTLFLRRPSCRPGIQASLGTSTGAGWPVCRACPRDGREVMRQDDESSR